MKLITHAPRAKKDTEYQLRPKQGLFIQLSRTERLLIERGDSVADVSKALQKAYPMLNATSIRALVTYYFTLGERLAASKTAAQPWQRTEITRPPAKKFLK
jgi:hypothetical protein